MAVCPIPDSLKWGMNRRANSLEWWEDAYLQMICTQQNMIKVILRPLQDWGIWVRKSVSGVYGWYSLSVASASYYYAVSQVNLVDLHTLTNLTFFPAKKFYHILFKKKLVIEEEIELPRCTIIRVNESDLEFIPVSFRISERQGRSVEIKLKPHRAWCPSQSIPVFLLMQKTDLMSLFFVVCLHSCL